MERILAILGGEEAYVSKLQRRFNAQDRLGVRAAAFTKEESLLQYMTKKKVALLLCETDAYHAMGRPPDCKTVLLSEKKYAKDISGLPAVFKYQSAQEIERALLACLHEEGESEKTFPVGSNLEVCTVCALESDSRESALAFAIAKKKSKNGRVLFVSLNPFYQPESSSGIKNEALTKAIYYIKQKSAGWMEKLNDAIGRSERVDCLYGVAHWADISECSGKEMAELLLEMSKFSCYNAVVADAGGFTDAAAGCMGISDRVILISGNGKHAAEKEREFLRQAKFRDADLEAKLIRVQKGEKEDMLAQLLREEKT